MSGIYKEVNFNPFERGIIEKVVPATEPQIEIWLSCQIGGDDASRAYNESISLLLAGEVRVDAVKYAIEEVVKRHDSIRGVFTPDGSQMCIYESLSDFLDVQDVSYLSPEQQMHALEEYKSSIANKVFDVIFGPLFFAKLHIVATDRVVLTLSAHHIICDGWSLGVILKDIAALYNAHVQNLKPNLHLPEMYSNYAQQQNAYLSSKEYKVVEDYWHSQFKDITPVLELPTDEPYPLIRSFNSHRLDFHLDASLVDRIRSFSLKNDVSFFTTLLSAFELVIHHISSSDKIVIGVPAAGQSISGMPSLVGHCVNLLPLLSTISADASINDYIQGRRKQILQDFDYQQITFSTLLRRLNITRDLSKVPLVSVMFNLDMDMDKDVSFYGLNHNLISNPRSFENFELFVNVTGSGNDLTVEWSYNTTLFKSDTINYFMGLFEKCLNTIALTPIQRVKNIFKVESSNELSVIHGPKMEMGGAPLLPYAVTMVAKHLPNNHAVSDASETLSYSTLDARAVGIAKYLVNAGVQKGDIVAFAVHRGVNVVALMLGILKAGATYLPLDITYPEDRLTYILSNSGTKYLVASVAINAPSVARSFSLEDILYSIDDVADVALPAISPQDPAYIIYTSGSTGQPKGIVVSHHNLRNFLLSMLVRPAIAPNDVLLAVTTVAFDIAVLELFMPLLAGAKVVIASSSDTKDGYKLLELIRAQGITYMQATPTTWQMLLHAGWDSNNKLKVLCGGEALSSSLVKKIFPNAISLWNMYGPTEATVWCTVKQIENPDDRVTIGTPIHNTSIRIVDDYNNVVKMGVQGELYIGGDGVAMGYVARPDLTHTRFVLVDGQPVYKSGDKAVITLSKEVSYVGRNDDQIKLRGYRIELGEIEAVLSSVADISESIALVDNDKLNAFVTLKSSFEFWETISWEYANDVAFATLPDFERDWLAHLQSKLPTYMIPEKIIVLKDFPLTLNGKIDKKKIKQTLTANTINWLDTYQEPTSDTEKLVSEVWAKILGKSAVSTTDDFFKSGGHSLSAIMVVNALEKKTGTRIKLEWIFKYPVLKDLAAYISELIPKVNAREVNTTSLGSIVQLKQGNGINPLYIVHGYGMDISMFTDMVRHLDPSQTVYGIQGTDLNDPDGPLLTMTEVANKYIAELKNLNKGNELSLIGYSFGGYIAFEMAKILKSQGYSVKLLGMLDAYNDSAELHSHGISKWVKKAFRQIPKSLFILKTLIAYPSEALAYQMGAIDRRRKDRALNNSILNEDNLTPQDKVYRKYDYAIRNYNLTPYDGSIHLFKVKKRIYYLPEGKYLGWKPYATGGINTHYTEGDHKTFLEPPNDIKLATILQKALNQS